MTGSDYTYNIESYLDKEIIVIIDLNQGNTSITNDIENVVREIERKESITISDYEIIYKDTDGVWDSFNQKNGQFTILGCTTWKSALRKLIKEQS